MNGIPYELDDYGNEDKVFSDFNLEVGNTLTTNIPMNYSNYDISTSWRMDLLLKETALQ